MRLRKRSQLEKLQTQSNALDFERKVKDWSVFGNSNDFLSRQNFIPKLRVKVNPEKIVGHFSVVFQLSRPNRKHFCHNRSRQEMRLVETNTLVETGFENIKTHKVVSETLIYFLQNFFTFLFTTLRKNFVYFFNNPNNTAQVFAFYLDPVS
jgi:hypothetical protein